MSHRNRTTSVSFIIALCFLVACADSDTPSVENVETQRSSESTVEGEHETELVDNISTPVSEQDLGQARQFLDTGRARWASHEPFAYLLTVGYDGGVSELRLQFDEAGELVSERIVRGDQDSWEIQDLPRSVDDAFADVDQIITRFETGEWTVPENGDCGSHLHARFNNEWGIPESYSTLGPCDDGVNLILSVTPETP